MCAERVDVLGLNGREVARLRAFDADHRAGQVVDALLAGPDRRRQPAAVPDARGQPRRVRLHPTGELLDSDGALEVADRIAAQTLQEALHSIFREVLQLMAFRVPRGLEGAV